MCKYMIRFQCRLMKSKDITFYIKAKKKSLSYNN